MYKPKVHLLFKHMYLAVIINIDTFFLSVITRETLIRCQFYVFASNNWIYSSSLNVVQEYTKTNMHISRSQALSRSKNITNLQTGCKDKQRIQQ